MAQLSEWLQLMLAEIARKREDEARARDEEARRQQEEGAAGAALRPDGRRTSAS
jgi:hypothetical protein